jgi:hypothetical protein
MNRFNLPKKGHSEEQIIALEDRRQAGLPPSTTKKT